MGDKGNGEKSVVWQCVACKTLTEDAVFLEVQLEVDQEVFAFARVCWDCWERIAEDGFILVEIRGHDVWIVPRADGDIEVDGDLPGLMEGLQGPEGVDR